MPIKYLKHHHNDLRAIIVREIIKHASNNGDVKLRARGHQLPNCSSHQSHVPARRRINGFAIHGIYITLGRDATCDRFAFLSALVQLAVRRTYVMRARVDFHSTHTQYTAELATASTPSLHASFLSLLNTCTYTERYYCSHRPQNV